MARNVGLIGSLRGKLGNAVFYVSNGVQVSRVYQPVVANPNTPLQVAQRAKMVLAGRMSKITPIVALAGLPGSNKRGLRGSFVREVVRASVYSGNQAAISFDNLNLSHGNVQLRTTQSFTRSDTSNRVDIVVSVSKATSGTDIPVGYGMRAVVYLIDNTNSGADLCQTAILNIPSSDAAVTTTIRMFVTRGSAANFTAIVYVFPFLATENLDGVEYSFVGTEEETYVVIDGIRSVAKLEYGETYLLQASA